MEFIKFPKIGQFRDTIKSIVTTHDYQGQDADDNPIYEHRTLYPTITFIGSVKLHGTNAGVCYQKSSGTYWAQTRNRILKINENDKKGDNCGFGTYCKNKKTELISLIDEVYELDYVNNTDIISVYGEWCGKGIQKGVAISKVDKRFIIFDIMLTRHIQDNVKFGSESKQQWLDQKDVAKIGTTHENIDVYNIYSFPLFSMNINFNNPDLSKEELVNITNEVERECPIGKAFGHSGIGEGVVWSAFYNDFKYRFKVKGKEHSSSKVTSLAAVTPEKVLNAIKFAEKTITENRLNQGIEYVFTQNGIIEQEIKKGDVGKFIGWVVNDVLDEEKDTMETSGFTKKDVNRHLATRTKEWFFVKYF